MIFAKGNTYYGPLGQRQLIPHLWFIITNPDPDGMMVVANMTDFANNEGDTTCVLEIGDHPQIYKQSVIRYCDAQLVSNAKLEIALKNKLIAKSEPASSHLIERIRAGALKSDDMEPRLARFVRKF